MATSTNASPRPKRLASRSSRACVSAEGVNALGSDADLLDFIET